MHVFEPDDSTLTGDGFETHLTYLLIWTLVTPPATNLIYFMFDSKFKSCQDQLVILLPADLVCSLHTNEQRNISAEVSLCLNLLRSS